jgi:predicted nucleotidyltransferase
MNSGLDHFVVGTINTCIYFHAVRLKTMATFTRKEIAEGIERLGQLAVESGIKIELILVGGALMVLRFRARESTRDVDVAIVAPAEVQKVRELARAVATEHGWPEDWLNDGAKGYLIGLSSGPIVLSAPGIEVRSPGTAQLLAMKLSAWRDDVDINDAARLLEEIEGGRDEIWREVERYLIPGNELKAQYAYADLWELRHGKN